MMFQMPNATRQFCRTEKAFFYQASQPSIAVSLWLETSLTSTELTPPICELPCPVNQLDLLRMVGDGSGIIESQFFFFIYFFSSYLLQKYFFDPEADD